MTDAVVRTKFVGWLLRQVLEDARGDRTQELPIGPSGRFWLGRLAPEARVMDNPMGDRGERLDPCATGIRVLVDELPTTLTIRASVTAWARSGTAGTWRKLPTSVATEDVALSAQEIQESFAEAKLEAALAESGAEGLKARLDLTFERLDDHLFELSVELVNCSPEKLDRLDTNLFECRLELRGLRTRAYTLEALPDSFRYDRSVPAYGINCGVSVRPDGTLVTTDLVVVDKSRPNYWGPDAPIPDFTFQRLADDPVPAGRELVAQLRRWGSDHWSDLALSRRAKAEDWSAEMLEEAKAGAADFEQEVRRVQEGVDLLERHDSLRACFQGMNRAIKRSARGRYPDWRPFQFGFLLANLRSLVDERAERDIADVVWFSTGGGKTETYLGLLVTAALFDRSRGKVSGLTAWSRFPLRMLSLQQTQRFADALGAAEIERREMQLGGDPFSLGFFVGKDSTPNKVTAEEADDRSGFERYRVIDRCPFCGSTSLRMRFARKTWSLQHICDTAGCASGGPLPLYIVDDEIYRFLPTVVVGTLDKAASISMQASMRGFVGAPWGVCTKPGHGYTYAPRSARPYGCLVDGCTAPSTQVAQHASLFAPTFRLQDELHLLRDSLGAIDSHYEGLYDDMQVELGGPRAKIVASSATLAGYEDQVAVLYRRSARVFPSPPPAVGQGFWAKDTEALMRRFVAIAPRGVTVDFAVDRILTVLQSSIRALVNDPQAICGRIGVPVESAADLVSNYGTDVVYGNTLRDLEAVVRSSETQVLVDGPLNTVSLTGKTGFEEVRQTLQRLQSPEPEFGERVHVVTASAMMSHGVDIDRLNVMVMLGLPLATVEFIQATARVGRTHPGLVFVMHKIGRERDAAVFRSFKQYVLQGDRFLEPIPITRHSRRVLERTIPGLALARILMIHEPGAASGVTSPGKLRELLDNGRYVVQDEVDAVIRALGLETGADDQLIADVRRWFERWEENIRSPGPNAKFLGDNTPGDKRPMLSLRDVETLVQVRGRRV